MGAIGMLLQPQLGLRIRAPRRLASSQALKDTGQHPLVGFGLGGLGGVSDGLETLEDRVSGSGAGGGAVVPE